MSNTQVSMEMARFMTNESNMIAIPNNNMMQTQASQIPNCNMMNGNRQYPLFAPQNMFACPMIPIGYGPYNQISPSYPNVNDSSPWISN